MSPQIAALLLAPLGWAVLGWAFLGCFGCSRLQPQKTALDQLKPCVSGEGPSDAYCGKLRVWEDRTAKAGRQIGLKIVVLPALRRDAAPEPLFFLAGGPGQGAAKLARMIKETFQIIQQDRDIVLVDQRGTGDSGGLECKPASESLDEDPEKGIEKLRTCVKQYEVDLRLYTTPLAMDDLDDVRQFLGYERINLYGGSYGTRAAMVYTRQYPSRVRAVALDGVAPPDMRLPLYMARDGQRALNLLVRDCQQDPACRKRFPDLGKRLDALLGRLESKPPRVKVTHPRTGEEEEITVRRWMVAGALFGALYASQSSALLPLLLERAEKNDFQGLLALASITEGIMENMSQGMHFSVVCSEDAPRIEPSQIPEVTKGTFFGREIAEYRLKPCEFWPRGQVEASYYEPVRSNVPALILSGDLDPVTPPSWGEEVARYWTGARHVVVPGTGHGTIGSGCVMRLLREFLSKGSASDLKLDCVEKVRRAPFFISPSGPDPGGSTAGKDSRK